MSNNNNTEYMSKNQITALSWLYIFTIDQIRHGEYTDLKVENTRNSHINIISVSDRSINLKHEII